MQAEKNFSLPSPLCSRSYKSHAVKNKVPTQNTLVMAEKPVLFSQMSSFKVLFFGKVNDRIQ